MIHFILKLYLLLFPQCELMVSWMHDADFPHCNDSAAHAAACYAASDWDYGGAKLDTIRENMPLMNFVIHLPLVRTVSCWR